MSSSQRPLIALVLTGLATLFIVTALLAAYHHGVRAARMERHLDYGGQLAARGELAAAAAEYRAALALEPENAAAGRALAFTLLSLDRLSEAESYLRDLLRRDPTSGALNRGLARIHAARGRSPEARAAYQRAIYGQWPGEGFGDRTATRFELIDYLKQLDARSDVIAELLRLRVDIPPAETAAMRRVADLFEQENVPDLAIAVLRDAAAAAPKDVELLAHLGAAEAAIGRFEEARATLRRARSVGPDRADVREQLAVVERVLTLDPTLGGLRLVTRTRRARSLLAAVVEHTAECSSRGADSEAVINEAVRRLRTRARADAEAAEQELALAVKLWSAFPECDRSTPDARAIAQVVQRVQSVTDVSS